jgi:SAM-dependent methyltransferase
MWEEKEFIDPFDKEGKYFWMKIEQLGRYLFAKDEMHKINYLSPSVLDVGCASGYGSMILSEEGGIVKGIDKNVRLLDIARSRAIPRASFEIVDLEKSTRGEELFDFVVAFEVLEHLERVGYALEYINSSLKTDGIAICSLPNPDYERVDEDGKPLNTFHKHTYSREEATRLFSSYGFSVERVLAQPYPNIFSKQEAKLSRKKLLPLNSADDEIFKNNDFVRYFAHLFAYPTEDMMEKSYSFVYLLKKCLEKN